MLRKGIQNINCLLLKILEIKPDGNAVTLENELLKKNQNSVKLKSNFKYV